MIYELLVQFFENGVATSKPEVVQVCPALRIKHITERGYAASDDLWFYLNGVEAFRRGGKCVPARFDDKGEKPYDAQILCGAEAGEAYGSSEQYQRTKLRFRAQYPPYRGPGRYADLICRPVRDLTS